MATTAREVVRQRRAAGEKIGLVKVKMYRPYPETALREACQSATKLAVLDRNYAAGAGGVFWQDTRAAFQGHRDDLLIQNYITGLCGGDVTPAVIDEILADIASRSEASDPVWMGIEPGEETLQ
jgi:pyruvate/2-oxoacid:ferredoxin oxidoreductase alpha subunit